MPKTNKQFLNAEAGKIVQQLQAQKISVVVSSASKDGFSLLSRLGYKLIFFYFSLEELSSAHDALYLCFKIELEFSRVVTGY